MIEQQARGQPPLSEDQATPLPTPTTVPTSMITPTPTDASVSEELAR